MKRLLNTLYVTTSDAYLRLDGGAVIIETKDEMIARVPLLNLESIVCMGYKGVSPGLMGECAEKGIDLCFLTPHGRFLARVNGAVHGNVLLRVTQHEWAKDSARSASIARLMLIAKIFNGRWCLERTLRDHAERVSEAEFRLAIADMKLRIAQLSETQDIDTMRGIEGLAAKAYFSVFEQMVLREEKAFRFDGRNRRPPLDRVNALLSFAYTLLGHEIAAALETVGLDPYVGFMHQLRPGRASLALDMLEELRAPVADRFVISLINLGVIGPNDFLRKENGAFYLKDDARKTFLGAWQKHKSEQLTHPFLKEKIPWGLVPYVQAMLLARYMRGDLDGYPPFMWK
ncbi:MAG: type I-C CRISPR-associated endonuclease Cas1c [Eubacteriales bacterium]|nr:type I-C CRISPR-associated endonuclease Cas1c [Eubacteriales bacterium]MDD3883237.1 type I-C CRISPR-associated endonuclease Cas1c [Eubacteriales bacterium]MDD4513841.1 type I-C CRISPR-associated endonuclease Cas1c [Eubacteriales bacterium]